MGFTTGSAPPVDPENLYSMPYLERIKILSRFWAEHGFGSPRIFHLIYIVKLVFLYVLGGYLIASLTAGFNPLRPSAFWTEPIFYQKLIPWTVLLEVLGVAGSWSPLAGHFTPFTGGSRTHARVDTIREPPWARVVPLRRAGEVAMTTTGPAGACPGRETAVPEGVLS
ncbi:DUF3556 domain-containing protein [Kribbella qitaiheensis]|uniref:DUF3556 domain-containing protein n=1 Tax=Kribbella qitaiheensis TaxID=1544730 RepID=UPI003615CB1A